MSGATPDPSAFIVSISPRDEPILVRTNAIRLVADHVGSSSAHLSRPDLARSEVRLRRPVSLGLALMTSMPPTAGHD